MESNFLDALDRFRRGEMVIVVDDDDRENEGDLIMLAEHASAEKTAFMVRYTTGILCVAITAEHAHQLRLPYMVEQSQDLRKTAFTVSIDLAEGITTGVSAVERTATVRALGSATTRATDFIRPGHIYPLIAHKDGLAARGGHTEAGIALAELTGSYPAALLSEIVAEDGSMARGETLAHFAHDHQIPIISIDEIKEYQSKLAALPRVVTYPRHQFEWVKVQLRAAEWDLATYPSLKHREQVVMRYCLEDKTPMVRIHSECFTGDVIHSQRCDCGQQLDASIAVIEEYGCGYIIYIRDHEGRGIGLTEKLKAYTLQNEGLDTVDANLQLGHVVDSRDWSEAIAILKNLNLASIKLLTNNPEKVKAVTDGGIACEQISLTVEPNEFNKKYLATKADRLGHTGGK
ncbi:3,4-dihydroxy-2-butanone-4-phosphate synthase [Candidatus Planktophila dulcis]|uniref:3,4-dihydroxy-2-butanone-4-phosphate synthase n=1 Tax=Candidatus Planktophila dulcis TaxID=1884914 RepID=UPI000BAC675C|nr:3,4-dihydroxy-2-butanone-4-phosphate synthase [Candidatus Planktophila dulcis]